MDSSLTTTTLSVSILGLLGAGFALFKLRSLEKLKSSFFSGNNGNNLEGIIRQLAENQTQTEHNQTLMQKQLGLLDYRLGLTTQKIGLVRFNPFADGGGNFSFSLALLDEHNDGAILTSMHGREQNRIYAKKISGGKAESALTNEELQAITEAINSHNKQNPGKTKTANK